jgi:hypothetical protein
MSTAKLVVLACLFASGCASVHQHKGDATVALRAGPAAPSAEPQAGASLPVLFPPGHLFELVYGTSDIKGWVFAESGKKAGQQTVRWLLLDGANFLQMPLTVRRATAAGTEPPLPTTAAQFAAFARQRFRPDQDIYVKSHADTFQELYVPSQGAIARSVIPVPVPLGRLPPEPKGHALAEAEEERYHELDGGTVGIRPPPAGGGPGGYLDPEWLAPKGVVGFAFGSPMRASNREVWLIPGSLFAAGLEGATVGPYRPVALPADGPLSDDWVAVVMASSHYRKSMPNNW